MQQNMQHAAMTWHVGMRPSLPVMGWRMPDSTNVRCRSSSHAVLHRRTRTAARAEPMCRACASAFRLRSRLQRTRRCAAQREFSGLERAFDRFACAEESGTRTQLLASAPAQRGSATAAAARGAWLRRAERSMRRACMHIWTQTLRQRIR